MAERFKNIHEDGDILLKTKSFFEDLVTTKLDKKIPLTKEEQI